MVLKTSSAVVVQVVRVRETQEYDIELVAGDNSRETAKLARGQFLGMTVDEQAANSIGVTARSFEVGEQEFDEDDLAQDR